MNTFWIRNGKYIAETKEQYIQLSLIAAMDGMKSSEFAKTDCRHCNQKQAALQKSMSVTVINQILENARKLYGETVCTVERLDEYKPLY